MTLDEFKLWFDGVQTGALSNSAQFSLLADIAQKLAAVTVEPQRVPAARTQASAQKYGSAPIDLTRRAGGWMAP